MQRRPFILLLVAVFAILVFLKRFKHWDSSIADLSCFRSVTRGDKLQPEVVRVRVDNVGWPPDDSCHKRTEARYWGASIIVSIVGTGAAIAAAIYAGGAFQPSKDQANIARQTLLESSRPWISVDGSLYNSSISNSKGFIYIFGEVGLHNVGHSPAQHVKISADVTTMPIDQSRARNFCQNKAKSDKGDEASDVIFPENILTKRSVGSRIDKSKFINEDIVSSERFFESIKKMFDENNFHFTPIPQTAENHIVTNIGVIGCVSYKTSADNFERTHRSSFAFFLTRKTKDASGNVLPFDLSKDRDWNSGDIEARMSPTPIYAD